MSEPADGGDGLLDVLARDEARRHLLEGAEARGEVLQALVARKVEQCVSRDHGRFANPAGGYNPEKMWARAPPGVWYAPAALSPRRDPTVS
jgi:hypothetical protein